jgi:uncharacterized protein
VLLVDTNVWVEAADETSPNCEACAELLRSRKDLATVPPVIAEAGWFIADRLGSSMEAKFLRVVTSQRVTIVDLNSKDWTRVVELVETYESLGLGTVDASIVAVAERLEITEIATMNGRDFYTVIPAHCTGFTLLPEGIDRSGQRPDR